MYDRLYLRGAKYRNTTRTGTPWTLAPLDRLTIMRLQYRALRTVGVPAGEARQITIAQQLVDWVYA